MKHNRYRLIIFLSVALALLLFLFLQSSFFNNGYRRDPVAKEEYYASHDVPANNEAKMRDLDNLEKKQLNDFKKSRGLIPSQGDPDVPFIAYQDLKVIYPSEVPEFPTKMTLYRVSTSEEEGVFVQSWKDNQAILQVGGARGNSYHVVTPDSFPLSLVEHEPVESGTEYSYIFSIGWCGDQYLWSRSHEKEGHFYTDIMTLDSEKKPKKLFTVESNLVLRYSLSESELFYSFELFTDDVTMISKLVSYSLEDETHQVIREETLLLTTDQKLTGTLIRNSGGKKGNVYYELMTMENEFPDSQKAVTIYRYDPLTQKSKPLFTYERPFSWISGQNGLFYGMGQTGERVLVDLKQMVSYSVPSINKSWNEGFFSFAGKDGFYFDGGAGFFFVDAKTFKVFITPWASLMSHKDLINYKVMKGWLWDRGCGLTLATDTPGEFVIAVFENTIREQ